MKKENVIGKAILTIPYIGYIGYFVRTPIGFILLVIIPATLLIIMETRNILKYRKQHNQIPIQNHSPNQNLTNPEKRAYHLYTIFITLSHQPHQK